MKQTLKKIASIIAVFSSIFFLKAGYVSATTFTVTNNSDSGAGSLRQAILDANADAAPPHIINFAIPGSGQQVIDLASNLPAINRPTLIDGKTQSGSQLFCDSPSSSLAPQVALRNAGTGGLWIYADTGVQNVEIRGLAFGPDIAVRAGGLGEISCNYFGTDNGLVVNGPSQYDQPYFVNADGAGAVIKDNVFATIDGVSEGWFAAISVSGSGVQIQGNYFNVSSQMVPIGGSAFGFTAVTSYGTQTLFGGENISDANHVHGFKNAILGTNNITVLRNTFVNNGAPIRTYDGPEKQNAPVITNQSESGGSTQFIVELDDTYQPGVYRLEFFKNSARRNSTFVQLGDPNGDSALHGIDAQEYIGSVEVTKNQTESQTFTTNIGQTGITFPTITATVKNNDSSFGGTSRLGYFAPNTSVSAALETNLGATKCFTADTDGGWTISVDNNGSETVREFALLLRYTSSNTPPVSQINYQAITTSGTVQNSDHVGVYQNLTGSSVRMTAIFWEGELRANQTVSLHLPVGYDPNDIYMTIVDINSTVPADVFDGNRMATHLQKSAQQGDFQTASIVGCAYATDLVASAEVGEAGIVPGIGGDYKVTVRNGGSNPLPAKPAFDSTPTNTTTLSFIAVDQGVKVTNIDQGSGVIMCNFLTPESYDPNSPPNFNGCETLCIDTALISGSGFDVLTQQNGYGMLVMCYHTMGLEVGQSKSYTVSVTADQNVDNDTRMAVFVSDFSSLYASFFPEVLTAENAPFDGDVLDMMTYFSARSAYQGESGDMNPYAMIAYGTNNGAMITGIAAQTPGVQPPGGTDIPSGGVSASLLDITQHKNLAATGINAPKMIAASLALIVVAMEAILVTKLAKHRHFRMD